MCYLFTVKSEVSEDAHAELEECLAVHGLLHRAHDCDDRAALPDDGIALRGEGDEVEEHAADELAEDCVLEVLLHGVQADLHGVELDGRGLGLLVVLRQDPQQPAPVQARVRGLHVQADDLHGDPQQVLLQRKVAVRAAVPGDEDERAARGEARRGVPKVVLQNVPDLGDPTELNNFIPVIGYKNELK